MNRETIIFQKLTGRIKRNCWEFRLQNTPLYCIWSEFYTWRLGKQLEETQEWNWTLNTITLSWLGLLKSLTDCPKWHHLGNHGFGSPWTWLICVPSFVHSNNENEHNRYALMNLYYDDKIALSFWKLLSIFKIRIWYIEKN